MTKDPGRGVSPGPKLLNTHEEEAALAGAYRRAAAGDAHHERKGGGPAIGGSDPRLAPTQEVPDVPLPDVAKPDEADGEAKGVTTGDARKDAELSGLEPGEMGGVASKTE